MLTPNERISIARRHKNMNQKTLAEKLGISTNKLSRIETLYLAVPEELIELICKELELTYDQLMGNDMLPFHY